MKICDICWKKYEPLAKNQRYCSTRCALDGENALRTAKRITRCVVCGVNKTRIHFKIRSQTCNDCRNVNPKDRMCARCKKHKPAREFASYGKLCAGCRGRNGLYREGWEGSSCLRCTTVSKCQFLVSYGLPVMCGIPDKDDWFIYKRLPADIALKAAPMIYYERFKEVQLEMICET